MANEWWRYDPETYRQGFGIIFHRAEGAWIVYETLLRSPAQLSGVKSGDILHSIAGQQFPTTARPTVLASTLDLLDSEKEHAIGLSGHNKLSLTISSHGSFGNYLSNIAPWEVETWRVTVAPLVILGRVECRLAQTIVQGTTALLDS